LHAEGWKWIAVATDFPYGHSAGLRRLVGETTELTEEDAARFEALLTEYETLEADYAGADDLPEAVDQRLAEIEAARSMFENRPVRFDSADIARAGIFVSIDSNGALRVERGFVRPEDEVPVEPIPTETDAAPEAIGAEIPVQRAVITIGGAPTAPETETPEEDGTIRPLSDRLVTELTAHRTLALRDGVANDPQVAFRAVLHALCLNAFYRYAASTCLEITAKHSGFSAQAPGLAETASAKAIDERHARWAKQLPETPADLWDTLTAFDSDSQGALFAHCASLTVNVVKEPWNRRPDVFAHGDQISRAVGLDMAAAGWKPTVDTYLGRVPKARILEAVREAKGEHSAQLIDHLKKAEMAKEAERLLDGTGWLPEPLRLANSETVTDEPAGEAEALPDFLASEEDETGAADLEEPEPHAIAAE